MLNDRQSKFCLEYLKDLNATQAAIRAGYSKKTAQEQSARLLSNVIVSKRIEILKAAAMKRAEITLDRVLAELGRIAFSNIGDFLTFGKDGVEIKESAGMSREMTACIAEVSSGSTIRRKKGIKLKLHDKGRALQSLLMYFTGNPGSGQEERKTIRMPLAIKKSEKSC
jgi:phage terminase small subunit